jgi:tRNA(Ile)-lysidine synthase
MSFAVRIPWLASASRERRWLVGVSGGADSVALLEMLAEEGFSDLVVCHLNHGLRGNESDADAAFVQNLAKRLGYPIESARVDISARMEQRNESMETAARHARHGYFATCAEKYGCFQVLLAHHADDQAETILWNLLRGSYGLKGMQTEKLLTTDAGVVLELIRPLLGIRRAELVAWLTARGLSWREDSSNAQAVAVRNRLRNEALPLLAEISGRDPVAAIARNATDGEDFAELAEWIYQQAAAVDPQGRLHLPVLRQLPQPVQRVVLRRFLQSHGVAVPDRELLRRSLALSDVETAAVVNLPGGGRLRRKAARLWVEAKE